MKRVVWWIILILFSGLVASESIFLSGHLEEGETTIYETEDGVYVLSLLSVSDNTEKATFRLNNEMSKGIRLKDSYVFNDGSEIVLRELILSESADGNDEAYYYFYGTGEEVLPLRNVSKYVLENKLCNFDGQCLNETKENCCYDCGCDENEECINNKCVSTKEEEVIEEEVEEVEEEVEEEENEEEEEKVTNIIEDKEKKVVYAILVIILIFVVFVIWRLYKKRKSIF